jgi:hypothetical protein
VAKRQPDWQQAAKKASENRKTISGVKWRAVAKAAAAKSLKRRHHGSGMAAENSWRRRKQPSEIGVMAKITAKKMKIMKMA